MSCTACRYFDDLFEDGYVEFADRSAAVLSLADSDHGRDVVWDHLVENWRANNTVPAGSVLIFGVLSIRNHLIILISFRVSKASVLNAVVSGFASEADQLEVSNSSLINQISFYFIFLLQIKVH